MASRHFSSIFKTASFVFMIRCIGIVFSHTVTLFVARFYGPDVLGTLSIALVILNILSIVTIMGLDVALVKYIAQYHGDGDWGKIKDIYLKALGVVVPACLLFSLVLYSFAPYLAERFFNNDSLSVYLRCVALLILPMSLTKLNTEALRGLSLILKSTGILDAATPFLAAAFFIGSVFFIHHLLVPVSCYALAIAGTCVISIFFWVSDSRMMSTPGIPSLGLKPLLQISTPMLLSNLILTIGGGIDIIMLGILATKTEVGIFSVSFKVANLCGLAVYAVVKGAAPKIAELHNKKNTTGLCSYTCQVTRMMFLFSLPFFIPIVLFPSTILGFFGQDFLPGVHGLQLMVFAKLVSATIGPVGILLQMTDRQKIMQNILLFTVITHCAINFVLIPLYGVTGAAIAHAVDLILWNILAMFTIKRYHHFYTISWISRKKPTLPV